MARVGSSGGSGMTPMTPSGKQRWGKPKADGPVTPGEVVTGQKSAMSGDFTAAAQAAAKGHGPE